jgi:hypothetical protein
MPITTMVGVGGGGLLNAGKRFFRPSYKGQPKGPNHSTRAREQVPREAFNLERVRVSIGSIGGGRKPPKQPTPAMTP